MSDFLTRLVQRQAGTLATVQPRTRSMFAPAMDRPDPAMPDLPAIDRVASSSEQRQPAEAPRHSIAPMHLLSAFLDTQRRIEAPVDGPSVTPPEAGARRSEPSHESPVVKVTAVPSAAPGKGPPVSLHNQIVESDRHAARVFSSDKRPEERRSEATAVQERAITPPPRLVESQQATPMPARVTPPSLLSRGQQGRPGDAAGLTSPEPPVHVTIGRIEVTALPPSSPTGRKSAPRPPSMSLADYLARRQGRGA